MKKRVTITSHVNIITIARPSLKSWRTYPDISGKNRKNIMSILKNHEAEETRSSTKQLLFISWFVGQ